MSVTITGSGDITVSGNIAAGNNVTAQNSLVTGNVVRKLGAAAGTVTSTGIFTRTTLGSDTIITFTDNGTLTINDFFGLRARVLLVGGGGGGGGRYYSGGGGGGQVLDTQMILPYGTIPIIVGAGGPGGTNDSLPGQRGKNTYIGTTFAFGGGGGGSYNSQRGMSGQLGACTGGNSGYDTFPMTSSLVGYNGGLGATYGGGGGGGMGGPGQNGTANNGGNGGNGVTSDITGSVLYYGAGGGGGGYNGTGGLGANGIGGNGAGTGRPLPTPAVANRGSGGGGTDGSYNSTPVYGSAGSSGIVVVRFQTILP